MMEENTVHKRNGKRIDIGAPIKGSMMHFNSGNRQMKGLFFLDFQIRVFCRPKIRLQK